jgi:hypothetical protein
MSLILQLEIAQISECSMKVKIFLIIIRPHELKKYYILRFNIFMAVNIKITNHLESDAM